MLSLSNVGGSQEAGKYYEQADDYYTHDKSPSQWQGRGSQCLGLQGLVGMEDFQKLLDGNLPNGDHIHVGSAGRRGGTDLTFSAPKSLSMQALIGGDERLIEAHQKAVFRALKYVETLAAYRQTDQGQTRRVLSNNLTIATFQHELSRACDPQLHTHCVVLNLTRRSDREWRALDNELLYRQKMLMGALYRAELAREAQRLGYGIRRTRADGLFELSHITDEQLKSFSARSQVIEKVLTQKGKTREEATAQEKKIIAIATRPRKTEVDRKILKSYWQEKCLKAHLLMERPEGAFHEKVFHTSATRLALRAAFDHHTERQAIVSEEQILRTALEYGVGQTKYDEIKKTLKQWVDQGRVLQRQNRYTTPQALEIEKRLLKRERLGRNNAKAIYSNQTFPSLNPKLNEGQREAIHLILSSQNHIVGVQGLAGTGKTFMLQEARLLAEEQGYRFHGLAPSTSAARELAKTGMSTETLAAFELAQGKQLQVDFSKTIFVVDEAGMVSSRQMKTVFEFSAKTGAKVVLVGDTQQLKAVEAGRPFAQLQAHGMATAGMSEIQRQKNPQLKRAVELAAKGAIMESVNLLQKEIQEIQIPTERYQIIAQDYASLSSEERKTTLIVSGTNLARKAINEEVRKRLDLENKGMAIQILERKDLTKAQIKQIEHYQVGDYVKAHREYRSLKLKAGDLARVTSIHSIAITLETPNGEKCFWSPNRQSKFSVYEAQTREIATGDRIRITENNRRTGLVNGDFATVTKVEQGQIMFEREDGKSFRLNTSRPLSIDHGYCSTVHAAQGKTCERVLIEADTKSLTSAQDSYYVAISRAKYAARIYTDDRERLPEAMARENLKEVALEIQLPALQQRDTSSKAKYSKRSKQMEIDRTT